MIHEVIGIVKVKPYEIILKFNTDEIRMVDFAPLFKASENDSENILNRIHNEKKFLEVKLDLESGTIYWEGMSRMIDLDGQKKPAPFDYDPEVLYEISKPISSEKNYH